MHFIVHWEFQPVAASRAAIDAELGAIIAKYSWVRPLTNFYVINVPSSESYQAATKLFNDVPKKYPGQIFLIVSPPMTGGTYSGYLPSNLWAELNLRSN
jgi:hypothetical protein